MHRTNFFSLALSDACISKAIQEFIHKTYPSTKKIYIISAADCKSCFDIGKNVSKLFQKLHPDIRIVSHVFLTDSIEKQDVSKFVSGIEPNDIVITPNISYASGVLIAGIVNRMNVPNLIFIGGDGWAHTHVAYVGMGRQYTVYHFNAWPLESKSDHLKAFKKAYAEKYGSNPKSNISFASYNAAMAGVHAFIKVKSRDEASKKIFMQYKKTVTDFISRRYGIYKFEKDKHKEELVEIVHFPNRYTVRLSK